MKRSIATKMKCALTYGTLAGAGTLLSACSWGGGSKDDSSLVPFSTISSSAYQSFVKNWNVQEQPVLCALIRSQSEWNYWFQAASTGAINNSAERYNNSTGNGKSTSKPVALAPPADYFDTRQLLLATREMPAPDSTEAGRIFSADKVVMQNGVLTLVYTYKRPASGATYTVKDFLLVEIPKERYTTGRVQFIENHQKVCEIAR